MPNLLTNKVALVTGGGSGSGRATALAFAQEGVRVVSDQDVNRDTMAEQLRQAGGKVCFIRVAQ